MFPGILRGATESLEMYSYALAVALHRLNFWNVTEMEMRK